jgi:translation initiation factor IF-3
LFPSSGIGGGLVKKKDGMRINRGITASSVRLILSNGDQGGILSLSDALQLAADESLDLVEIAPQSEPPVCKIMNYGKYKFQQSKKQKDAKQKQKQIQVKEIKLRPRIDEHDFQTKVRHIRKFIEHGDKVRVFVHFRGREMAHRELGLRLLDRTVEVLGEDVVVEKRPSMEGNQMSMFLIGKEFGSKSRGSKPRN